MNGKCLFSLLVTEGIIGLYTNMCVHDKLLK